MQVNTKPGAVAVPSSSSSPLSATIGYSTPKPKLNATIGYEKRPDSSVDFGATLLAPSAAPLKSPLISSADTLVAAHEPGFETAQTQLGSTQAPISLSYNSVSLGATLSRTTVLPRLNNNAELIVEPKTRYAEEKRLGAGGIGEVLAARDQDIDRLVAIKRLLPDMQEPSAIGRFVDEIRTVGRLEHPNIVPIHDVGIDEQGRYFFVMKHLHGETLEAIIEALVKGDPAYHRKYSFERRARIFQSILEAISYAHDQGIVHRDIKPANIMIGDHGEVVVMDWGIAKRLGKNAEPKSLPLGQAQLPVGYSANSTAVGSLLGTPAYMSPEQAMGANHMIDERSDIYSLCVLFHEFLCLKHYLAGASTLEGLIAGVIRQPAPFLGGVSNPFQNNTPADLSWFVAKGVEKEPAKRYQSVAEMLTRLHMRSDGYIPIQCHLTFAKRVTNYWIRFLEAHPLFMTVSMGLTVLAVLVSLTLGVIHLVRG